MVNHNRTRVLAQIHFVESQIYFADIHSDLEKFQTHKYYRIEFDLDVVSTSGVVTTYKYKLLVERADNINPLKNRRYPKVYHQFYEFGDIMSAKKYTERK